jgi:glycosyltransferase involved in cell wall biosynthesis
MDSLRICFIGTFPPTHCGLATFTQSLMEAITAPTEGHTAGVVRVMLRPEPPRPREVAAEWLAGDAASRARALHALNDFDVAVLQHEYGIYPGAEGEDVVGFLRESPIPVVVVLHTVLSDPSANQRRVLEQVMELAEAVVVPTQAARARLLAAHEMRPGRLAVIAHGAISNLGAAPPGRREPTVLTWGLIGPGKGLEYGIEAMHHLRDLDPAPVYVIAGETHPKVKMREGERYREGLMKQAAELGVTDRVVFKSSYLDASALRRLARSADVILLPYESREQICSGVLVEAVSTGKPVVATAFPHAVELLSSACGIVVPHENSAAIAGALRRLWTDRALEASMKAQARREAERLAWPAVGQAYLRLLHRVLARREAA